LVLSTFDAVLGAVARGLPASLAEMGLDSVQQRRMLAKTDQTKNRGSRLVSRSEITVSVR
jgi:hypothetical protein